MKTYRIAVIGGGFMGRTHSLCAENLRFYYDVPFSVRLSALCGRTEEKTRALAKRLGFERYTTDFGSVLADESIDIVDICTPNPHHYPQAKAAILAGKHVYCDKPLCVTAAEAYELAELAEERGAVCQVAFQHRFWAATMRAKKLIAEGGIGDTVSFRGVFLHSSSLSADKPYAWRYAPVGEGGGVLNDLGSHLIDLVTWLAGDVAEVRAVTQILHHTRGGKEIISDDAAYMLVRLKNGACGTLEASKLATGENDRLEVQIHGTRGAVEWSLEEPGLLRVYGGDTRVINCMQDLPEPCDFIKGSLPGWVRAHLHSYYSFVNCVHTGAQPSPSFAEAARVQEIIESARESEND